jgi:hypothetical protein
MLDIEEVTVWSQMLFNRENSTSDYPHIKRNLLIVSVCANLPI